jgi:hypothetical protein
MMNEALRAKTREQALRHALFQMKVYRVFGQHTCIFEDNRPNRGLAPPLSHLLVLLAGRT